MPQRQSKISNSAEFKEIAEFVESEVLNRAVRVHLQSDKYGYINNTGKITLENTLASEVYLTLLFEYCNKRLELEVCGM